MSEQKNTYRKTTDNALSEAALISSHPDVFVHLETSRDPYYETEMCDTMQDSSRGERLSVAIGFLENLWEPIPMDARKSSEWYFDLLDAYPGFNRAVAGSLTMVETQHIILPQHASIIHRNATLDHVTKGGMISPHPWDDMLPPFKEVDIGSLLLSAMGWDDLLAGKRWTIVDDDVKIVLDAAGRHSCSWFWCGVHAARELSKARKRRRLELISPLETIQEECLREFFRR